MFLQMFEFINRDCNPIDNINLRDKLEFYGHIVLIYNRLEDLIFNILYEYVDINLSLQIIDLYERLILNLCKILA